MSTPNPLIPQGSFQAKASGGASNVRIAVATIVAIHVVFFGGLLLQGCKRDTNVTDAGGTTNAEPVASNLTLPPMETSSTDLYYTNAAALPPSPSGTANNTITTTSTPPLYAQPDPLPANTSPAPASPTPDQWGASPTLGTSPAPAAPTETKEYTVARGDSFYKIAKANGLNVRDIQTANPNIDPARIQPGMKLKIPAKPAAVNNPTSAGNGTDGNSYKVKPGDNLTKIAKAHGTTVSELRAANNLRTSQIQVGQVLKIPAGSQRAPAQNNSNNNPAQPLGF